MLIDSYIEAETMRLGRVLDLRDWRNVEGIFVEINRDVNCPKTQNAEHRFLQAIVEFTVKADGDSDRKAALLRAAVSMYHRLRRQK